MVGTHAIRRKMDISRASAARIYDAFLGGSHNFGIERDFVDHVEQAMPGIGGAYRENRAFVRRAVEHLLEHGIRQFLDLGSGIPTIGHVHEVARRRTSGFRVLYVDNEPLTVAHSRSLLADEPRAEIITADIRDPDAILCSAEAADLLDLSQPVALLMTSMLHFVPGDPRAVVDAYKDAITPGSYLAVSHLTDSADPSSTRQLEQFYAETADPLHPRSTAWIESLFDGLDLLPPGASFLNDWRPDPNPRLARSEYRILYGGLAKKP